MAFFDSLYENHCSQFGHNSGPCSWLCSGNLVFHFFRKIFLLFTYFVKALYVEDAGSNNIFLKWNKKVVILSGVLLMNFFILKKALARAHFPTRTSRIFRSIGSNLMILKFSVQYERLVRTQYFLMTGRAKWCLSCDGW